ncbi:NUP188 [Acanthosepion pharaonis]|uniref:NUP188 n=1 Tax=Acanthosepion pharaonis TaxID=158019 RepID=A0A812DLH8_ACAPH|nr:NUP188 [Sepia pharaonis]
MTLCQLNKDRKPYIAGNFTIPAGTYGHHHLETVLYLTLLLLFHCYLCCLLPFFLFSISFIFCFFLFLYPFNFSSCSFLILSLPTLIIHPFPFFHFSFLVLLSFSLSFILYLPLKFLSLLVFLFYFFSFLTIPFIFFPFFLYFFLLFYSLFFLSSLFFLYSFFLLFYSLFFLSFFSFTLYSFFFFLLFTLFLSFFLYSFFFLLFFFSSSFYSLFFLFFSLLFYSFFLLFYSLSFLLLFFFLSFFSFTLYSFFLLFYSLFFLSSLLLFILSFFSFTLYSFFLLFYSLFFLSSLLLFILSFFSFTLYSFFSFTLYSFFFLSLFFFSLLFILSFFSFTLYSFFSFTLYSFFSFTLYSFFSFTLYSFFLLFYSLFFLSSLLLFILSFFSFTLYSFFLLFLLFILFLFLFYFYSFFLYSLFFFLLLLFILSSLLLFILYSFYSLFFLLFLLFILSSSLLLFILSFFSFYSLFFLSSLFFYSFFLLFYFYSFFFYSLFFLLFYFYSFFSFYSLFFLSSLLLFILSFFSFLLFILSFFLLLFILSFLFSLSFSLFFSSCYSFLLFLLSLFPVFSFFVFFFISLALSFFLLPSFPFYISRKLHSSTKGGHLVQWVFTYNCWKVLTCEIQELLFQVSRSPNMITADQTCQASQVVGLLKSVLSNVPHSIDQFQEILELCYQVIHRFAGLTSPPLDLIAVCVETLTQVAKKHPHKVWQSMKQTGLLPYFTEHLGNADVFSSKGLRPGMYGTFLAGFECPQGRYPLSLAFLDFISTVVMDLSQVPVDNEISATVLFILTEVFPSFYKWRYYNATRREAIGHKCLEIFHKILDVMAKPKVVSKKKLPNLQKMCVHNLLYTEAGQSLLNVISIGVDAFNDTVTEQGGFFENKSTDLIDLIQISFSVLNRLLLLKAPDLPLSPVERALSLPAASQQEQHIVLTVAQYIYHQHAPKLPTMALLLLKRLAVVSPMSILAILGNDAEPMKDKMLSRLSAVTEDLQLKVAILELLSVCVVTQPGLIELFLNLKLEKPNKDGKKELLLGNSSCLNTVMNLIMSEKQKTYQCPPNLLCACIEFLHALWGGMRETAMSVLRKINYFWPSICEPLKRNIGDEKDDSEETQLSWLADIKTVAYVFMILAHESYSVPRDKLEESFKAEMAVLSKQNRIQYWSNFIRKSLHEASKKENMDAYLTADTLKDDPILLLLRSWKNWLITITKLKVPGVILTEELKIQILSDLLSSIQCLVKDNVSVYNLKLACIASATYFTVMTSWVGSMNKWSDILEDLQLALDTSFCNKECLIPAVQIGLVASLTTLLQLPNQQHVNISDECLISLLRVVCSMLLECVRNLFPVQGNVKSIDNADTTNTVAILQGKQQTRIKLLMTSVLLLQEIILNLDEPSLWIPVLHNHLLIPTLLTTVQMWIKAKQGLPFVDSALTLLLTISKTEQGAKILMSAEVANHLCLSISSLYSMEDLQQRLLASNRERNVPDNQNCDNVLCLSIDLYASMLTTLKHLFLKETLDFVGVHQDRLLQSLELSRINLTEPALKEAHATCRFIYQMSFYARDWKFHLPKVLSKLMTSLVYMCQTFVSLLVRPRYLQHILEHAGTAREDLESKRQGQLVTPISAFLQHTSHDDLEQPTAQCLKVQKNILSIIGICLSSLRQFTPDLCEMLMDQSMDVSQYDPFLAIGFNAPSIDQDAQPTFGTLLACINMCMTFLPKVDPRAASPQKGNESIGQVIPKNLVLFVLENSLLLIMSQACRYLKEPTLSARDKQMLKRELSADLNTFLQSMHRHMRKGTTTPISPCGPTLGAQSQQPNTSPTGNFSLGRAGTQSGFSSNFDQGFYRLVSEFVAKVLR